MVHNVITFVFIAVMVIAIAIWAAPHTLSRFVMKEDFEEYDDDSE